MTVGEGEGRLPRPEVVVLDVNETLSDMRPMADRFAEVGAPGHLAATWFASVLRDGFALAAAGTSAPFAQIAREMLRQQLSAADLELDRDLDAAADHVLDGFGQLDVHPDVVPGLTALDELGVRLVTLTNGATSVAEGLLERVGARDRIERFMSVDEAGLWKPAPASYHYALEQCGVTASEAMLVAVHPWDVDGARRAGLRAAWVRRAGRGDAPSPSYPGHFEAPELTVESLVELADRMRD